MADFERNLENAEENDQKEEKVRDELKTDKTGYMKIGDIVLLMMKRGTYCGMISADGVISKSVTVIPRESDTEKGANVLTRSCLFRIESASKSSRSTQKKSEYELKSSLGKALTYGERVQLRHLHSMCFISVNTQSMASEAGCLQVEMAEESNDRSWFELVSTNKLRKDGEIIRYSDSVYMVLVSKKSQYYIHADESQKLNPNSRIEVNASGSLGPWMVRKYTSYDVYNEITHYVKTGDSLRIFHKVGQGYLTTKVKGKKNTPEVVVQQNNLSSNSFWELQKTVTFFGGPATWKESFRIKHVATGYFLCENSEGIGLTPKAYDEGTLFSFIPDQIQTKSDILYGLVLSIQTEGKKFLNIDVKNTDVQEGKKKKKNKFNIRLVNNLKNFAGVAFILEDVSEVQTSHVYKLSLVSSYINDFNNYINEAQLDHRYFEGNPDKLKKNNERCEDFLILLQNISKHIIFKSDLYVSLEKRQSSMRELGIVENLLESTVSLYSKFINPNLETRSLSEVLDEIYILIYNSIKSNRKNCKHIVEKQSILISQLKNALNRGVGRILKEIFKYSNQISAVNEEKFEEWVSQLAPVSKSNISEQTLFLNILQYIFEDDDKGQLRFQSIALKNLTSATNDFTLLKFHILNKRPVIEFDFPSKSFTLRKFLDNNPELHEFGLVIDEQNLLVEQEPENAMFYLEDLTSSVLYINYVSAAIEFLSNICISRYTKAIQRIPKMTGINLSHIALVLRNVNISEKLRAAYSNFCRVLFVDLDPFFPYSLHQERCYIWDSLETVDDSISVQRRELLLPIREILKNFWGKQGGTVLNVKKPGKSLVLITAFLKLTRFFIDLNLETDEFIEEIMNPLCLLIMKNIDFNQDWTSVMMKKLFELLESDYYPSLENKLARLQQEILNTLHVITLRRQNLHVREMLILYKAHLESPFSQDTLKIKFQNILEKLNWDIVIKYNVREHDLFGIEHDFERSTVYHMNIYLLDLSFEVSGGRNPILHKKLLKVVIEDSNLRRLLARELKKCEFLFDNESNEMYQSIVLFSKRLYSSVTLLIQEQIENSESVQVLEAIKDSISIIQDSISYYKTSRKKVLFQNLLFHTGLYHLCSRILGLRFTKSIKPLFESVILLMHIFCKKNKRNQKIFQVLIPRLIELINELDLTELLCEMLSSHRMHITGQNALRLVFELVDKQACTVEFLRFLRGFLKDSDGKYIKPLQIDMIKSVFNSQGIKNILANENQDIFSPQYFIDSQGYDQHIFELHIEILKVIIGCSVNNSFGILQGRKLIPLSSLIHSIIKPNQNYFSKETYLRYLQLIYHYHIEGEVESDCNINSFFMIFKEIIIPDLAKFKKYIDPILDLSRKGVYKKILKNPIRKKVVKLSQNEIEIINYWEFLTHSPTWCDDQSGIFDIVGDMFRNNTMPLDSTMENLVRELKLVLYEINDTLQLIESENHDIDFSHFIFAANSCRESLPRTAIYSNRGPAEPKENSVIAGMQQYIIENKLSLEEAFSRFELDGNGSIDFEEFRVTIRKILTNVTSSEVEIAFNEMDEDHDGRLQFSEFSNKIRKYFSKTPRIVVLKKIADNDVLPIPELEHEIIEPIEVKVPNGLKEFVNECFLKICEGEDMKLMVQNVKKKYIDPALISRDSNLAEIITKLGQVFYKKKYKIYLIKLLRMIVPEYKSEVNIFDEIDHIEIKKKKEFMKFQLTLSDAGVLDLALSMIHTNNDKELVEESVKLLISLLKLGNQLIQNKFLNLLKQQNSSELFAYIRNELREFRDFIEKNSFDAFVANPLSQIEKIIINDKPDLEVKVSDPKTEEKNPYLVIFLLELVQLCCDNCFLPFQTFVRAQERNNSHTKQISINMIDEIASFLINIKQIGGILLIDYQAASVVQQCFETLIDTCRGPCIENQILLGSKIKLYKFVNTIFKLYNSNKEFKILFKSSVRYISALLEGNFSNEIAKSMIDYIDFKLLASLALEIFNDFILPKKSAVFQEAIIGTNKRNQLLQAIKEFCGLLRIKLIEITQEEWEIISVGFQITIITRKLRERFPNIEELQWLCFSDEQPGFEGEPILEEILVDLKKLGGYNESFNTDLFQVSARIFRGVNYRPKMDEAYEFYTSLIGSIEISKDDKIEKCYFQVPTCMIFLNEQMRRKLIYGVNRNSNEEKIKGFLFMTEKIQIELTHLQAISRIRFLGWMVARYTTFANILYFIILCSNIIVIFTVSSVSDRNYDTNSFPGNAIMTLLGTLIIVLSLIMYFLSLISSYPLIVFDKLHKQYDADIYDTDQSKEVQGTIKLNYFAEIAKNSLSKKTENLLANIVSVAFNLENLVNLVNVVLACLGWYNPFFYAIMMLDILRRSDTLKSVLLVITKNKKSLMLTLILLIIIGYVYGVWAFIYLGEYYQLSDGGNYGLNTYCDTLVECFSSTISLGVRSGGGVGDAIYPAFISQEFYSMRQFFDISFFIIVNVILLNIIFGIIVDTFAELRDNRREMEDDIANVCFICGKEKHEFELRGSGWYTHIQLEHSMWTYLAYIIYIKKKPMNECDGIEKYVKNQLSLNDISFIPTTALCLAEEKKEDIKEDIVKDLEEIHLKLKRLKEVKD